MNVRIESMSHGDGKVYLQLVLDRLSPQAEVLLDAHLKDGTKIPSHLFPFVPIDPSSAANYVVILPHFDVREVDLTFVEFSGAGEPLGQSRLTVEMNMMRWRTRFNALVHNELMAQMFGFYCFRSVKSKKASAGDFGYWCVPIVFPADDQGEKKEAKMTVADQQKTVNPAFG